VKLIENSRRRNTKEKEGLERNNKNIKRFIQRHKCI
jgi:hypothetical protein